MKNENRIFVFFFALLLTIGLLIACGGGGGDGIVIVDPYTRTADTAGDWQVRFLHLPGSETSGEGASWMVFNATMDSTGLMGNISTVTNSGASPALFEPGDFGQFKVTGDGTVHLYNSGGREPYFSGFMNAGSSLIIAAAGPGSAEPGSGVELVIGQRVVSGTTYLPADREGHWKGFMYRVRQDGTASWGSFEAVVNSTGGLDLVNSVSEKGPDPDVPAAGNILLAADGRVTLDFATAFDGFMSADKKLVVGVSTPNSGIDQGDAELVLLVKSSDGTIYDATDLAGSYGMVGVRAEHGAAYNSAGWSMGNMSIDLPGKVSGSNIENSDLTSHDMLSLGNSTDDALYDLNMYADLTRSLNGGYVEIEGFVVNSSNNDILAFVDGPGDAYMMGMGSDKDLAVMVMNSVEDGTHSYELNIFHRASSCLSSECTSDIRARTPELAGQWRASMMMVSNTPPPSDYSLWMMFNGVMGADGVVSVGFSNILDPGSGNIRAMEDILPPGEGPDGEVLRVDANGYVWPAKSYMGDLRGFMNSSGDYIIGTSANFNPDSVAYQDVNFLAIQNRAGEGLYDMTTDVAVDGEWRIVWFEAGSDAGDWSILNAIVSNVVDAGSGCMELGYELQSGFTVDGSKLGVKAGITLGANGDLGLSNAVSCSDPINPPMVRAYMSFGRDTAFGIANGGSTGNTPEFWSFVKVLNSTDAYSQSDLSGNWIMSTIRGGDPGNISASQGRVTMTAGVSSSVITGSTYNNALRRELLINDGDGDGVADVVLTLEIDTTDGTLTMKGDGVANPEMTGFMAASKTLIYILENDGSSVAMYVLQKDI